MMIMTLWLILTLILSLSYIVKFLKRGKAPGPDNIHNEVLQLGTTTSWFHHLARLFTSFIQIGYIPTAWKLATLRMLLKPDKLPSLTTSYRPISLMSSIMKLFEWVIEQRLSSYLEDIGFINKYQSGFRQNKSTDDHLFRLSQSVMESFMNVLEKLCEKWGMEINLSKTKVIVFRNGGVMSKSEKFFYRGEKVKTVTYYRYLGLIFPRETCGQTHYQHWQHRRRKLLAL